ncbi:MAG: Na+/H+ antiporter NhaB [Gammaproteobacteria bacterium]|jgi:Na+/H+ antiporter NhaB
MVWLLRSITLSCRQFFRQVRQGAGRKTLFEVDITKEQFDVLAVDINTGTNLPSVTTPSGQAAFLFLMTSALAPLIFFMAQ